jgi:hypothetical protein
MRECRTGAGRADRPQHYPAKRQTYLFPPNSTETGLQKKKCANAVPVTGGRTVHSTALGYVTNLYFPAKFNRNRFFPPNNKKCANAVPVTGGRTVHSTALGHQVPGLAGKMESPELGRRATEVLAIE